MARQPKDRRSGDTEERSSVPITPAERHLAALAAEGRERQAAALAAEKAEARRIEREERREVEKLGRANVRNSLLDSPRGKAPPLLAIAVVLVVAGAVRRRIRPYRQLTRRAAG
jgi:hypothetical protein